MKQRLASLDFLIKLVMDASLRSARQAPHCTINQVGFETSDFLLYLLLFIKFSRNNFDYFPVNKDSNFQDYLLEEMWNTTAAFNEESDIT